MSEDQPDSVVHVELPEAARRRLFIVIAAFNESAAIADVVRELRVTYPNVVVVDDGSIDDTWEHAARGGAIVLRHLINRGQGAALQTGITYALQHGAEVIATFDADGQHCPEDIPALVLPVLQGQFDIALGSRFLGRAESMPRSRRLLLRAAITFTRLTSGLRVSDTHNGLRAFSRSAAEHFDIQLDRMAHASELIDQVRSSGLPYCEVPVHIRYTRYSLSKGQRTSAALRVAMEYLVGRLLR